MRERGMKPAMKKGAGTVPRFMTDEPALLTGKTLVIADTHVGIEYDFRRSGINVPSGTGGMLRRLGKLVGETGAEEIIILGDVKHKVPGVTWQELREVPEFLKKIRDMADVTIVPGNHDPGIEKLIPKDSKEIEMVSSRGFRKGKFYFSHGHTWPDKEFMKADYVMVGHEHPQVEFRDGMGYRFHECVWLRADLDRKKIEERYGNVPGKLPELIVMPKFNRLSGSIPMNRPMSEIDRMHGGMGGKGGIGTLVRSSRLFSSRVYLLDGTFLGRLSALSGK